MDATQRLVVFEQWPAARTITLSGTQSGQVLHQHKRKMTLQGTWHRSYPERVVIYATCVPRKWLPSPGADAATAGGRPAKRVRPPISNKCAPSKPSKCVPAAALAPLVVVTVTVGDEEPFCRAVKN